MKLQPRQKRMMKKLSSSDSGRFITYGGGKSGGKSRLHLQKKPSRSLVNDYQLSWLYARKYCKENNIAFHSSRVKYLEGTPGLSKFIIDYRRKEIVNQLKPIFKKFAFTALVRGIIGIGIYFLLESWKILSQ